MSAQSESFVNISSSITEDDYEQTLIEYLQEELSYLYLYGPDVKRTSEKYDDIFLPEELPEALQHINPNLPRQAIQEAIRKISSIDAGKLEQKNEVFNDYLQYGVEIRYFDGEEEQNDIVRLLDFNNPEQNSFYVVNQWTVVEESEKRPDIVIFVNGIPLVIFELKSPSREETDASDAYLQLRNYMQHIPSMFVPNVFCVMSDMADTRVGTITADEDRFVEWKSVDGDYSTTQFADWKTLLDGMFPKDRLLDIVKNFVCFDNRNEKTAKILAGYHQYFAVHKAAERTIEAVAGDGKIGVFWHTQGSGKSLSMVFLTHLLEEMLDSPTFVVITDRNDLDGQLYGQFSRCKDFLRQTPEQAESRAHLKKLLRNREANGIIFTTMQKFMEGDGALCDRENIVVMVDEAHRGQYGLTEKMDKEGNISYGAARLVRDALPHASYIGFTGTPIETDDKNTREIFGEYIDIYDMTQAVEDGATRPVYYESRVVNLHLDENVLEELDREYDKFAEEQDESYIDRSKRTMAALDNVLSAPETIDSLCKDIIQHYENGRADVLSGKAMIVAHSRNVAMQIYYRLLELRPEWKDKLGVVMTMGNQDPEEWFEVCGGKQHKKNMERRFKDEDDPLKIVIVVDMWLTGFDVPCLATMYVFKPMKGHNLMQAIARVNRVYKDKEGGLVVDYIGIANALKRAMKEYTNRDQHNYGNMDIAMTAYPKFLEKLDVCRDLLYGYDYAKLIFTDSKTQLAEAITDAVNWLLDPQREEAKEDFLQQCKFMNQALSLCKSLVGERDQHEAAYFAVVRVQILRITGRGGNGGKREFNDHIAELLQESIKSEGVINIFGEGEVEFSLFDESVLQEIAQMKQHNVAIETLRRLIEEQIKTYGKQSIVKSKKFSEMLQRTVNGYMNGMLTNAEVIEELLNMAHEMMDEREEQSDLGLNDEELAFYDALTKPEAVKDFYENDELIEMTRELTDAMRASRTIDWQKKESARAGMRRTIKHLLKKHKYPPEGVEDAMDTVMAQCEYWADSQVYEED